MNEKPLERLNYFNGQRLQAADLKLEQEYHIRVRRWLNRSLYSSGIAEGLSVYAIKGQPQVRVTAGLAIDHLGREIILLEEQIVHVVGTHHDRNGRCDGPYLTVRYQEDVVGKQDLSCAVGGHASDRTAWGAPGRILAGAVLELNAELPNEASGKIPLACLTLSEGCMSVRAVDTGVRRYIGEGSANKVKQYALEGTRDITPGNNGIIRFHIRGRQPAAVTLFLRSEEFPSYFYTELGGHSHGSSAAGGRTTSAASKIDNHTHLSGTLSVDPHSNHTHTIRGWFSASTAGGPFDLINPLEWGNFFGSWPDGPTYFPPGTVGPPGAPPQMLRTVQTLGADLGAVGVFMPAEQNASRVGLKNDSVNLTHTVGGATGLQTAGSPQAQFHTHTFNLSIVGSGADIIAESGDALHFIDDLQVWLDDHNVTPQVLDQIRNVNDPNDNWVRIGIGGDQNTDPFASKGSGAIRLDFLAPIDEREHVITLKVPKKVGSRNGGRIHFNLYVE